MQHLSQNELRQIQGGNPIIKIIEWGLHTYRTIKRINESNYPIGPIYADEQGPDPQ